MLCVLDFLFFFFLTKMGLPIWSTNLRKMNFHILVSASSFLLFRKFCPSEHTQGSPYGACSALWEPFTGLGIQWAFGKPVCLKIKVTFSSRLYCLFKGVILVSTYAISCLISQSDSEIRQEKGVLFAGCTLKESNAYKCGQFG